MKTIGIFLVLLFVHAWSLAQTVYEVRFKAGVTLHRGALVLYDDGTGKMRVRYYDQNRQKTVMVEQLMRVENTDDGYRITGYNPVYASTGYRHPSYVADNFYLSQDEYGTVSVTNIDDQGVSARSTVKVIEGAYQVSSFLSDFDWKLE